MNPKPLSALNHLTVPVGIYASTLCVLATRSMLTEQQLRQPALRYRTEVRPDGASLATPRASAVLTRSRHGHLQARARRAPGRRQPPAASVQPPRAPPPRDPAAFVHVRLHAAGPRRRDGRGPSHARRHGPRAAPRDARKGWAP